MFSVNEHANTDHIYNKSNEKERQLVMDICYISLMSTREDKMVINCKGY